MSKLNSVEIASEVHRAYQNGGRKIPNKCQLEEKFIIICQGEINRKGFNS